jgi:hypothetical protein
MEPDSVPDALERSPEVAAEAPRGPRRSVWLIVAAAVLVLVVYPLSYGPVMYQVSMGRLVGLWYFFDAIYAPIEWFANSSEFGEDVVDWYLGVWGA